MPSNLNISDFQGLGCKSSWKCQAGDSDGHQKAGRALRLAWWRDLTQQHMEDTFLGTFRNIWKLSCRRLKVYCPQAYGKNQGNLSWGCSCYLCSWVSPEETWITILILSWPGPIPMCRFRERNTLAKVHNQFIDGVSQWGRKEPCFIKTTISSPTWPPQAVGNVGGEKGSFSIILNIFEKSHF